MLPMTASQRWLRRLAVASIFLVSIVVILGAWTRLTDSGLGCPDWPGCYGYINVMKAHSLVNEVNSQNPGQLRDAFTTIPEMVHRYAATLLGLFILIIAGLSWKNRKLAGQPFKLPLFLLVMVIAQGILGKWTVTMGLQPTIVMLHLMGGFTTFTLLVLLTARLYQWPRFLNDADVRNLKPLAYGALSAVILQIALGGWVASNYAAVACTTLPVCEPGWTEQLNFKEALTFWGHEHDQPDYEFGVKSSEARTTIHVMHRFGALLVIVVMGWLVWRIRQQANSSFYKRFSTVLGVLLSWQILLGVLNVVLAIPISIAVAHNFFGVVLLAALVLFIRAIHVKCPSPTRTD